MELEDLEYRVLVCGGRKYDRPERVGMALDVIWMNSVGILTVIEGGAHGADQAAGEWADKYAQFGVVHLRFPAKWRENGQYNPSAGFERNARMISEGRPDLCVFFPGGNGTRDMVTKCKHADIPVVAGELLDQIQDMLKTTA